MKLSVLLETVITSGLSMTAKQHGGVIDNSTKVINILTNAAYPETGYLQNKSEVDIKIDIRNAVVNRDLSLLIDMIKEIHAYWPGEYLQYAKAILELLEEEGYTTQPLYLERDHGEILPGHPTQDLPTGQVIYRLRQVYTCIINPKLDLDTRLQGVSIFISMLICSPHLQRKVIGLCITPEIQVNHFDPLLPHARLVRLRTILTRMARDELYDLEAEDKAPVVPPLQIVDEEETDMSKYEPKPEPWLHFTGTDHLTAMKQEHGDLANQVQVFKFIINSKTNDVEDRIRSATAYIHRSKYQEALTASIIGADGVRALNDLNDSRLRANEVRKAIEHLVRSSINLPSIYKFPGRQTQSTIDTAKSVLPKSMKEALRTAEQMSPSRVPGPVEQNVALEELLKHFGKIIIMEPGLGKTLKDIKAANEVSPAKAVSALLSQLNFVNSAEQVMIDEATARVKAALPELYNDDGTINIQAVCNRANAGRTDTVDGLKQEITEMVKVGPKPIEISGGDAQIRADIAALFESRGQKVKFTDEVPKITFDEMHTYECQVGGAVVTLEYRVMDHVCKLTAVADANPTRQMQPLLWQAMEKDVPEIWSNIRQALNYDDAYRRIEHYLIEQGYIQ